MKNRRIIIVALLVALLQVCNLSLAQEAEPNYLRFYHLSYFNSDFFIKAYDTGTCVFEFSNGKMMKSKNHTEPNGNMMIFVQLPTEEDSIIATILFNNEELGYFVSFLKRTKANYTKWLDKDTKGKERKMSRDVDYSSEMMMVNWYNPQWYAGLSRLLPRFKFDENDNLLISIRNKVKSAEGPTVTLNCVFSSIEEIDNLIEMLDIQKMLEGQHNPIHQ